jgi:KUP system potassium uptake protein
MNSSHSSAEQGRPHHHGSSFSLIVGALGVVFGDIGTSPIYTLKECFSPESPHHIEALPANILGVVSLIIWSIVALICVKYLVFVLRADNKGEGGVLSLMALATQGLSRNPRQKAMVMCMGLVGAALLFGDGMITPAI